ncbi:hypothetical protein NLI96_g1279 [Meripilus lineatus]|uniref:DUF427 domain-containing protein n=1 Tax=Meripilus lineatus TaxID=2056292 RepID=A0AAD5VCE0_9APHY|nr:hypothetical protein NLI96_g1279 [Physisporinus lineatus]
MVAAILNGTVIAESNNTVVVENNHYFPPESVDKSIFSESSTHTTCPWKGRASYFNATVDGQTVNDIAWYYPMAKPEASTISGYIAFYKSKVKIQV